MKSKINLVQLLYCLIDRAVYIIAAALLCAILLGSLADNDGASVRYSATSKLYLLNNETTTINLGDLQISEALTNDYIQLFSNQELHQSVIDALEISYSTAQLRSMVSVNLITDTHILNIRVISANAQEAKELANTYAVIASEMITEKMNVAGPIIFEKAVLPTLPVSNQNLINVRFLGAIAGAFFMCLGIVAFAIIDDRIRTSDELEEYMGASVLGVLTEQKNRKNEKTDRLDESGQEMINMFLCKLNSVASDHKSIVFTASHHKTGNTYLMMQIAKTLASMGKRVVLVDADIRNSKTCKTWNKAFLEQKFGITHFLRNLCPMEEIIYRTDIENVYLIPCTENVCKDMFLFDTSNFEQLMQELYQKFDVVLVDAPPIGVTIDAVKISRCCDGMILVTWYNKTRFEDLKEIKRRIQMSESAFLGSVINRVRFDRVNTRKYYRLIRKMNSKTIAFQKGTKSCIKP